MDSATGDGRDIKMTSGEKTGLREGGLAITDSAVLIAAASLNASPESSTFNVVLGEDGETETLGWSSVQ